MLFRSVLLALLAQSFAEDAPKPPASRYETREKHDRNGIGKFFMGREIAHVMGHQAADWLERPEREREERTDKLVELLGLKPGMAFADIGCGSGLHSIAALQSGAGPVHGFDYDPDSVAASRYVRSQAGDPAHWTVEQGSVLDEAYVDFAAENALRLALKYPQKFAAVSAHSAALVDKMGNGPAAGFGSYFKAFGEPFDSKYWNDNTPFALIRAGASTANLKIYFDCGAEDDFGFAKGAQDLHKLLEARKVPHEFHLYPGGHDAQYVAEHIDESLQFQSRALGAK